ncbi:MAG: AsmA-like C-terminal domain-containing protein [Candidatus Rokubacteria bacterium]|nr:AsmA-like C-terminal domain-containing protein [Candidatus Rokubacteria bacterium]
MRRRWLAVLAVILLVVLGVGLGLVYVRTRAAQELIRAYLETTLSRDLGLPVRLERLGLSLRLGRVDAYRAALLDPETGLPMIQVERLRVTLDLWPLLRRELRIRSVSLSGPRITLEDSARLRGLALGVLDRLGGLARDREGGRFPLKLGGGTFRYRDPASGTAIDADGLELSLVWPDRERALAVLTVRSVAAAFAGRRLDRVRLEANAQVHRARWEVTRLKLEQAGSSVVLEGSVIQGEPPRVELAATGVLVLDELAPLVLDAAGWKGRLMVKGRLSGTTLPSDFEGTARLTVGSLWGLPVNDAEGSLGVRGGVVELTTLTGRALGGGFTASGIYEPDTSRYRGRVTLKGVSLPAGLRQMGWASSLTGQVTGSLEGSGQGKRAEALSLRFDLAGRGIRLAGGQRATEGQLVGRADAGILKIERLTLARGASRASARGSANLSTGALALMVSGAIADLSQDLWPHRVDQLGGQLAFSGRLGGNFGAPSFSGQATGKAISIRALRASSVQLSASGEPLALTGRGLLEAREVEIGPERLESVRAVLDFKGSEIVVPVLTARRAGLSVKADGAVSLSGRYRFALAPIPLDLAQWVGPQELSVRAVLRAAATGDLSQAEIEGELALADTAFRDIEIGSGRLRFLLDAGQWRWELGLDAGVSARGTAPLTLRGQIEAEVSATDLDLTPYLRALRRQLPFPLTVRADGNARLSGELPGLGGLRGEIELTRLDCRAGDVPCQLPGPAALGVEAGTLRFESLELVGPGLSVTVDGSVRPGERTDLRLRGYAPFRLIEWWVPPLTDLRGTPDVQLALTGPPGRLKVTGRAELRGVEVRLRAVPLWLTVAAGDVTFGNDRVEYVLSEGLAVGGRLEGRGSSVRAEGRWRHTLELKLDRAQLDTVYDQLQLGSRWASGNLSLRGSLGFDTGPAISPLRTLGGNLSASIEGGSFSHYPGLVRIFGLLTSPAQPFRLPDLTRERMPYRRITADFRVAEGVMETRNLVLDSEVVRVSGVGTVRVSDHTLDLDLAVRPLQVLEGGIRKVPLLRRLLPESQGLAVVYFKLQGPWEAPKTTMAPVKSLSQTVVDLLLFLLRALDRLVIPQ